MLFLRVSGISSFLLSSSPGGTYMRGVFQMTILLSIGLLFALKGIKVMRGGCVFRFLSGRRLAGHIK